jgi:anthranilate phosphoribosyltransferase
VLQRLGSRHVMVVYGLEGLDEISVSGETMVGELKDGEVREYKIHPRQLGIPVSALQDIQVADATRSRDLLLRALSNEQGPARDIVAANAGAAIYVCGLADSLETGVERARVVLASGAARRKLDELVEFSCRFKLAS